MQHTEKYKFNLIETSDTFNADALNANAEAMERELAALEAAASSALTAHAADSTRHAFVKLGSVEVPAAAPEAAIAPLADGGWVAPPTSASFHVDDPALYTMLLVDIDVKDETFTPFVFHINGSQVGSITPGTYGGMIHGTFFLFPAGIRYGGFRVFTGDTILNNNFGAFTVYHTAWSGVTRLDFSGCDSPATVTVYGFKK